MDLIDSIIKNFSTAQGITAEDAPVFSIDWPSQAPWTDRDIVPEEVYYFFDQPLLFSVAVGPFKMLFQKWSEDDGIELFTVTLVDQGILDMMLENQISVFGAVTYDLRYMVEMDGMFIKRVWPCSQWNIPASRLPSPGVALSPYVEQVPDRVGTPGCDACSQNVDASSSLTLASRAFTLRIGRGVSSIRSLVDHLMAEFPRPRHVRHLVRGTCYDVVYEEVSIQAASPIAEGDKIAVYVGEDGKPWGRPVAEFNDGRFETL